MEECRICLVTCNEYISLLDEYWLMKMTICSSIQVFSFESPYPKALCLKCSDRLDDAYQLRLQIEKSEELLSERICKSELYEPCPIDETVELKNEDSDLGENLPENDTPSNESKSNTIKIETTDDGRTSKKKKKHISQKVIKPSKKKLALLKDRARVKVKNIFKKKRIKWENVKINLDSEGNVIEPSDELVELLNCSVTAYDILDYQQRMRAKRDERPNKREQQICDACGKVLASQHALKMHINAIHTADRPEIRCNICLKIFKTRYVLNAHVRNLHAENKRRFSCDICGSTFNRKGDVKQHKKRHLNVRPYSCELCDKKFVAKHYLTKHMRSHTGETPYKCEFCSRSFTVRWNLSQHQRQHTLETPYKCSFCQLEFRYNVTLKSHVKSAHKLEDSGGNSVVRFETNGNSEGVVDNLNV